MGPKPTPRFVPAVDVEQFDRLRSVETRVVVPLRVGEIRRACLNNYGSPVRVRQGVFDALLQCGPRAGELNAVATAFLLAYVDDDEGEGQVELDHEVLASLEEDGTVPCSFRIGDIAAVVGGFVERVEGAGEWFTGLLAMERRVRRGVEDEDEAARLLRERVELGLWRYLVQLLFMLAANDDLESEVGIQAKPTMVGDRLLSSGDYSLDDMEGEPRTDGDHTGGTRASTGGLELTREELVARLELARECLDEAVVEPLRRERIHLTHCQAVPIGAWLATFRVGWATYAGQPVVFVSLAMESELARWGQLHVQGEMARLVQYDELPAMAPGRNAVQLEAALKALPSSWQVPASSETLAQEALQEVRRMIRFVRKRATDAARLFDRRVKLLDT